MLDLSVAEAVTLPPALIILEFWTNAWMVSRMVSSDVAQPAARATATFAAWLAAAAAPSDSA